MKIIVGADAWGVDLKDAVTVLCQMLFHGVLQVHAPCIRSYDNLHLSLLRN